MKALVLALLVPTAGCLTAAQANLDLRPKLEQRAAFDMDCRDIQLRPLEETRELVTSYGVIGCGKRATYVLNVYTQTWILNVMDGKVPGSSNAALEAPPPEPPPPQPVMVPRPK